MIRSITSKGRAGGGMVPVEGSEGSGEGILSIDSIVLRSKR